MEQMMKEYGMSVLTLVMGTSFVGVLSLLLEQVCI